MYGLSVAHSMEAMNAHKPPAEPRVLVLAKPAPRRSPRLNAMKITATAALLLIVPALDAIA